MSKEGHDISRRSFIKNSAIGAAGVAAAAVLPACAPAVVTPGAQSDPTAPAAAAQPTAPAAVAAAPSSACEDWLGQAPGITDAQVGSTITSDVVIVGAGVAGIAAARAACEANPKAVVTVIEAAEKYTVRGLEFGALDAQIQKDAGVHYDHMQVVRDLMQISGNRANPSILKKWADESGETFDWFEAILKESGKDFGYYLTNWPNPVGFDGSKEYYPEYCTHIQFKDWVGAIDVLYNKAVSLGAKFIFSTRARQLVVENGAVKGVYAEGADKKLIKVVASKGVILATGDYGNNEAMVKALAPEFSRAVGGVTKIVTSNGDGHKMAIWAGGVMEPGPHAGMAHAFAGGFGGIGATAALQLNAFGKRYANEDVPGQPFTNQVIRQPNATSWQIFDANWQEMIKHQSIGHGNLELPLLDEAALKKMDDGFRANLDASKKADRVMVYAGNTLEELFGKIKLPVDAAKASVERYNELCKKGSDDDFGKRADRMFPVDTAPFFAAKAYVTTGVVCSGVVVDTDMKVLDSNYAPIPGLWAVGNTAGGRFAGDYPVTCPAISHGSAITFGRSAGTQAAKA
jgi:succinate dehydrogenase/fumarate reductase flavoprotein subunit